MGGPSNGGYVGPTPTHPESGVPLAIPPPLSVPQTNQIVGKSRTGRSKAACALSREGTGGGGGGGGGIVLGILHPPLFQEHHRAHSGIPAHLRTKQQQFNTQPHASTKQYSTHSHGVLGNGTWEIMPSLCWRELYVKRNQLYHCSKIFIL